MFVAALLAVLGLLSAGHQARHLGLLWIATEAVTLAAVPLLHFNGTPRAFEATWKYLLVGGTGIALSLLGSFCLGYASLHGGGGGDLTFAALTAQGAGLSRPWVLIAWVLLLVGYGTKMGLAPMHTWKPDAYGEAPGIVGAMLAGGVTTVAFTAILRVRAVVGAAGEGAIADRTLLVIGLFSMLVAALFLLGTRDFKRMLAYSSVEHMGILSIGAALGGAGVWAALFHVWSNSLTKGALFLSAGNIRRAAGSRTMDEVRGMARAHAALGGDLRRRACSPSPRVRRSGRSSASCASCARRSRPGTAWRSAIFLGCLLFAFFGLTRVVFAIVDGRPRPARAARTARFAETAGVILPPLRAAGPLAVARPVHAGRAARGLVGRGRASCSPRHERRHALRPAGQRHAACRGRTCPSGRRPSSCARPRPSWTAARACARGSACRRGRRRVRLVAVLAFDADNTLAVGRSAPFTGSLSRR